MRLKVPKLAAFMDEAEVDAFAFMTSPKIIERSSRANREACSEAGTASEVQLIGDLAALLAGALGVVRTKAVPMKAATTCRPWRPDCMI